jgi:O-antigen ligase
MPTYLTKYPLGAGIGSVGPATSAIGGSALGRALNGETEFTFLIVETGIPGLLVMLAFVAATLRAGFSLRLVKDPGLQRCLMALTAVLIALTAAWFTEAVSADSPTSPFLWLAGGCLAYWYGELRSGRVPVRRRLLRKALGSA